jgi:Uma2 family endonuclease
MSAVAVQQQMNAEEFIDWCNRPENQDRRFELERGEVVEMALPGERFGNVCLNVGSILHNYTFQQGKGYACSNDTGLILERDPDTVRVPDVVLYAQARRYDDLSSNGDSQRPPKLVVVVLSPNDKWGKVTRRITDFLVRGIAVVWLVDPEGQSVTVYRRNQLPQVFEDADEVVADLELPGLRCRVADFFYVPGDLEIPPKEGQG